MIASHYSKALDAAALILALARCRLTDREPAHVLQARQNEHLLQLVHDFCFHARKAIELANAETGAIAFAQVLQLHGFGETEVRLDLEGKALPLVDQSLWWVLGRVIHSQEAVVESHTDVALGSEWASEPNLTEYETPVAFGVRSDRDGQESVHYFLTERLVEAFLHVAPAIEQAVAAGKGAG